MGAAAGETAGVVIELDAGVYWMAPEHATDRPALGAIAGENATLMVDAGASVKHARQFLDALETTDAPPVRHVVLTHSHWDHVFGAAALDASIIATEDTRAQLRTMAAWSWSDAALDGRVADGREIPFCRDMLKAELNATERAELTLRVPNVGFRSEMTIDLGGRSVHCIEVGGDHAPDSCIVVAPGSVAFLSDCVYHNLHVEPNYLTTGNMFPLLDRLLSLDVGQYVLGHGDTPMPRADFESMACEMRTAGELARKNGATNDAIRGTGANAHDGCDADAVAEYVKLFQQGRDHEVG